MPSRNVNCALPPARYRPGSGVRRCSADAVSRSPDEFYRLLVAQGVTSLEELARVVDLTDRM